MIQVDLKKRLYFTLSFAFCMIGLISWIPYVVFDVQAPFGMITFILNPVGLYLGYLANNRLVALGNLFLIFSSIPVMFYVYWSKGYIPM